MKILRERSTSSFNHARAREVVDVGQDVSWRGSCGRVKRIVSTSTVIRLVKVCTIEVRFAQPSVHLIVNMT
jgi:hypothetical protein